MCVAAIAWQAHPHWLLVAIGNRDEYHERPAAPLAAWDDGSGILAGRDLQSGGTWMGVSAAGRFALVTNLRGHGGPQPDRTSRGALVTDLLTGHGRHADPASTPLGDFNPFNLIVADRQQAGFLSNRPDAVRMALAHGLYGLSNGPLDQPWPKTLQLKGALTDWLGGPADDVASLFAALREERLDAVGLPPREPSDVALEAIATPVFINNPVYGTRCATVVTIDRAGHGTIIERRFSPQGDATGETALTFDWSEHPPPP